MERGVLGTRALGQLHLNVLAQGRLTVIPGVGGPKMGAHRGGEGVVLQALISGVCIANANEPLKISDHYGCPESILPSVHRAPPAPRTAFAINQVLLD